MRATFAQGAREEPIDARAGRALPATNGVRRSTAAVEITLEGHVEGVEDQDLPMHVAERREDLREIAGRREDPRLRHEAMTLLEGPGTDVARVLVTGAELIGEDDQAAGAGRLLRVRRTPR